MHLEPPKVDGRTIMGDSRHAVVDRETGKSVGFIRGKQGGWTPGGIHNPSWEISLFGRKYNASFDKHEECCAFAKGVQAVFNHLMSTEEGRSAARETEGA